MKNFVRENPEMLQCVPGKGIGETIFECFKKNADKVAQINTETEEKKTFQQILTESICVAQEMSARGISSGDVISLCTYNQMDCCTPIVAATFLLAKLASLDSSHSADEMKYMLNLVKPKMIFVVEEVVYRIESAIKEINLEAEIVVFGSTETHTRYIDFLVRRGTEENFLPKTADDLFETAFIFFSSGTTGFPKGICLHHYGCLYIANLCSMLSNVQTYLSYTSPYWISYLVGFLVTTNVGASRIICKEFSPQDFFEMVEKYQLTNVFLAPTFTYSLSASKMYKNYNLSSLKLFSTGGGAIAVSQLKALGNIFPDAVVSLAYGLTETSGMCAAFLSSSEPELTISKTGSSGKPLPGMCYKIVDPETEEIMGTNQPGEILVKAKFLMNGYYNNPEETKKCFDSEGFLKTGDIGYFDEDGCLYVVDRIKEMFKYRSWHILPAELEQIIMLHPAIQESVIIGYPHEEDGDLPMAVVVLKDDATATEQEIVDFFNERIQSDRKKLRGGVKFVKNIPITATGKYLRRIIRKMIVDNNIS